MPPLLEYRLVPPVTSEDLNVLFASAWQGHRVRDFGPVLSRSLAYVCAYAGRQLAGFVNLAWDGGCHAFLLDTTVHSDYQRCGIGRGLVRTALQAAEERGIEWVHVDFEAHLTGFYSGCGFKPTEAGLIHLAANTGHAPHS